MPITQTVAGGYVLIATESFPASDLGGLIDEAHRRPGELNYASVGSGSGPHLCMALLEQAAGLSLQHIRYKDSPQQLAALISGEVQVAFDTVASVVPLAKAGRVKVLAIAGRGRWVLFRALRPSPPASPASTPMAGRASSRARARRRTSCSSWRVKSAPQCVLSR